MGAQYSDDAIPGPSPPTLTVREEELLGWAAEGKRSDEIATILGIGTRTVEKHFENVFEKLKVETRGAAVAVYQRRRDALQTAEIDALRQENEALRAQIAALRAQLRQR